MEFNVLFLNFSNLKEDPFRITPDANYVFLTEGHATAQSYLGSSRILTDGFAVITGETGSGKSILIKNYLPHLPPNVNAVEIHQTKISPVQFLQTFPGCSADNDIQINSEFTSPHHARIVSNATTCVLEELNSTNGTYVNSKNQEACIAQWR